ncbi:DNA mismatch repair endonuclease MutL [Pseudalkalibacillus berkeleyi]|uniref:DNA mismatch repair protein MutL n=1 Tax=Pseudalkalibacillus berkeleyi TaxID=1069813 RepID=A0ABS9H019_9BACL|nr:DNA mismatch repair endonuclease MutL [Pseudalkalibacillus berkeleyi]MCF6137193.1 DNA mismatch repair endonuclease MutL [Pseudalkalibacillus berkeleyi]
MGKIKQLDDLLSNKIAAGEVVERPASIVKELVENSIDANSTRIDIEVEEGGLSKLIIIDNGDGIENEDLLTAFQRHATSKIQNENDLFHIRTLGFRGEALPSIASVSKVDLKTSTGRDAGNQLTIQFGKVVSQNKSDSRKGTTIEVTKLFHNTPARLKHLKTIHTELGNITDVINRQAMGHPDIAFHLKHNGKTVLKTPGNGDLLQVVASIYGISVAKQMLPVSNETLDYRINGYAVKPEVTRASRQYVSLFINGRYIKNFKIYKAIEQAYHTLLPIGRHPIVILSIDLDPILVDVNVHPGKLEARFSKEQELALAIEEGIKKTLRQTELIPKVTQPKSKMSAPRSEQPSFSFDTSERDISRRLEAVNRYDASESENIPSRQLSTTNESSNESKTEVEPEKNVSKEEYEGYLFNQVSGQTDENSIDNESSTSRIPVLYPVGQVHGTYIIAQNELGMYVIDQHAAQERIKYEYFREKVGMYEHEVQELIVPITFEFTHSEATIIQEHQQELSSIGIFLEPFGGNTFIVRSHPQWFPSGEEQQTIQEIIDQVLSDKKTDIKKLREDAAIMMSCKGSIKANRHLRHDEMVSLIRTLRETKEPFTCPHGRPILIQFSSYELEKMFKRVM